MAVISSSVNCGFLLFFATLKTPPVAVILIKSAPFLYLCLTAFLASLGPLTTPSFGPGSPEKLIFNPLEGSACPPVVAIDLPAL